MQESQQQAESKRFHIKQLYSTVQKGSFNMKIRVPTRPVAYNCKQIQLSEARH